MNISKINSVSFGKHYTNVDIGASSIKGSMKICAVDEDGKVIKKERTTVFDDGEKRSENKFEENVAKKIALFEEKYSDEIEERDPENEAQLTVCYPGAKGKNGFTLSNFFYDDEKTKRFFRPISPDNIDSYLKTMGINISQTRHANDMAGAGGCLLSKLESDYPEALKEGDEIMFFYPGGGLGTGAFVVDDDNIKIKPMEIQHIRNMKTYNPNISLEDEAGAAGLRRNYLAGVREYITEDVKFDFGEDTKVVTSYEDATKYVAEQHLPKSVHDVASYKAIEKYMYSMAQIIAARGCESRLNTVVITGPIANGVREAYNSNIYNFSKDEIQDYTGDKFTRRLKAMVDECQTPIGKKLLNPEDLNVIFMQTSDNTEGAQILQRGKEVGSPVAWYNIKKEN